MKKRDVWKKIMQHILLEMFIPNDKQQRNNT